MQRLVFFVDSTGDNSSDQQEQAHEKQILGKASCDAAIIAGNNHDDLEAVDDIAIMKTIPNMTIIAPADADEMRRLMPLTVNHQGPIYIRLAKGHDPIVTKDGPVEIGKAVVAREGKDAVIITTGITLRLALEATEELTKDGIEASILHMHTVKPLDEETIIKYCSTAPVIVTIEEHSIIGGLGSSVAELVAEKNLGKRFKRIAIPNVFPEGYGSQAELMEKYSVTKENLVSTIKDLNDNGSGN